MNYGEIESLLTEANAEAKKANYSEVERICGLALEIIPHKSTLEASKSEEEWKKNSYSTTRVLNTFQFLFESWNRGKNHLSC